MGKVILSGVAINAFAPLLLSSVAEGSIIKINEDNNLVDFYVAKHDYESSLNGVGRTLVVRKEYYDKRQWHTSNVNKYATSAIDTWLNSTYKGLLDSKIQQLISTTQFWYTPKGGESISLLSRAIFLLSAAEVSESINTNTFNKEGTLLPIYNILPKDSYWTRTPFQTNTTQARVIFNGTVTSDYQNCMSSRASRPAFTLPSTLKVDDTGMVVV